MAQLAAGYHQSIQADTSAVELPDVLDAFAKRSADSFRWKKKSSLTDDQIWIVLCSHGYNRSDMDSAEGMDVDTAQGVLKKQVSLSIFFQFFSLHVSLHRRTIWCKPGDLWFNSSPPIWISGRLSVPVSER